MAICTRERPEDLTRAIQAVVGCGLIPEDILVIDNNPVTTRTREVVERFPSVRYVREERPGLEPRETERSLKRQPTGRVH